VGRAGHATIIVSADRRHRETFMPPTQSSAQRIGVLMLETRFPRPVGDVGHPQTFSDLGLEAIYRVLPGVSPQRVVHRDDPGLLHEFVDAAHELVSRGATLITTSCGFLVRYQAELSRNLPVLVITSSLLLCRSLHGPAVLTIDADALSTELLHAAGVSADTPIIGVPPNSHFRQQILGNQPTLDLARAQTELVALVRSLRQQHPDVQNLVLECTNMPPYTAALQRASGFPVHHLMTAIAAACATPLPRTSTL
jgi:hypothetical protein